MSGKQSHKDGIDEEVAFLDTEFRQNLHQGVQIFTFLKIFCIPCTILCTVHTTFCMFSTVYLSSVGCMFSVFWLPDTVIVIFPLNRVICSLC